MKEIEEIKKSIRELMETIIPELPEIDEHTLLDDIWFDLFCKELLARELEREYMIIIPSNEIDRWETFGDIVATVERYQH